MESGGLRENGRHRQDQYRGVQTQWMIPSHLMKDQHALSVKIMTILSERDTAFQERDLALSARKVALAERDMAILQRDTALAERNSALIERDNIIAAFEYRENATISTSCSPTCQERLGTEARHMHHSTPRQQHLAEYPYRTREMHITETLPIPEVASEVVIPQKNKRCIRTKPVLFKRTSMPLKKGRTPRKESDKQLLGVAVSDEWKTYHSISGYGEDLNKELASPKEEQKDQDLGLDQVIFEDSSIPVPVCSCTGARQQCYKWGQGGWQSACCTTTMSVYPLPMMPNKRHARVSGRKMSSSAFTKLLSRLAIAGYDLSSPVDLKDHWAKHGTNRYITIK